MFLCPSVSNISTILQMYADSTDFSGVPDPTLNNTIASASYSEDDGDQYVAREQRQYLEPLFAQYNVIPPKGIHIRDPNMQGPRAETPLLACNPCRLG
jgi:hypothetical protein